MDRPADFVAIDFETANPDRASACQVGVVRADVVGRRLRRRSWLLRPPTEHFGVWETRIHGLTWADVRDAPSFGEAWSEMAPMFDGAAFVAAHNAPFDRSVLRACCLAAGAPFPALPWRCTAALARTLWPDQPAGLHKVALRMGFDHQHHDALSDAEASARIFLWSWRLWGR